MVTNQKKKLLRFRLTQARWHAQRACGLRDPRVAANEVAQAVDELALAIAQLEELMNRRHELFQ